MYIHLDPKLKSYEERNNSIEQQLKEAEGAKISAYTLERIATYLLEATNLEPRGEIITPNRLVTVNKRETSREGLVEKLEGGESAFHQLIKQDKNVILTPKVSITQEDIDSVPGLKQLREEIDKLQKTIDEDDGTLDSKTKGKIKQIIIEMRRDQYVLKNAHNQPMFSRNSAGSMDLAPQYNISLQDKQQVLSLLVNYANLKSEFKDDNASDIKWILEDLDDLIDEALVDGKSSLGYILYSKIIGANNEQIRLGLIENFGIDHTEEYISSLYRNKIPELIAQKATEKWIDYIYMNKIKGVYKRCSRCGEIKLANNRNFSINRTSSSQFYSICKLCRNNKK